MGKTQIDLQNIVLETFRNQVIHNPNSSKYTFPLKNLKSEMDKLTDEERTDLFMNINLLEQENLIIIEDSENPALVLLTLTDFGKEKILNKNLTSEI